MASVAVAAQEGTAAPAAYDAFAAVYDDFTAHQDYDWWWSALLPLAEAAGLSGTRVLDVACGTGKSLGPLLARGWTAVGTDASGAMLAQARRKLDPAVPLLQHDMRGLPVLGSFDLVSCLNDALNNVLDEQQLVATFAGFRRNLAPGGVVIFDVNTIRTFRDYGALVKQEPDRVLVVEGRGEGELLPGGLLPVDFTVLERRDAHSWSSAHATHLQRHHPDADVRCALSAAGLEFVSVHGQLLWDVGVLDELRDEKAVYVARAPRERRGGER